ncbi:ferredoxin--NADP reductase [Robertkochia solimangrovi]|uniref:ferredoxin--NADP reductase n=1 Tax=Robertkochia solimangrovi TaxID=2213046 RepID=UPI00117C6F6E|nr:ferredoxin--NADP reductase [Robertkochia solimangrovi]TRZ46458.1 flavodoxin reductase [Robertkochia solimangrovi]
MTHFHPLKVKELRRLTPNAVALNFDLDAVSGSDFLFKAGQYITIKKEFNGKEIRRSYSICTTPSSGELEVGIKRMPEGTFSEFANSELKEGDILEVHSPEGKFTFEPAKGDSSYIAAFAAGSGITPIMSIMKTVLEETDHNFLLVFGNKSISETMFHKEILELISTYPDRLYVQFIYSRTQEEDSIFGRIERSTVNFIIKNKFKEANFKCFYLCGPEAMVETISTTLQENGVSEDTIKTELFTSDDDGADISDSIAAGKTRVKVIVDDEESEFVMDRKQRVLDAVLAEDIDAPYSCQGGICSSCIARLTEGKVEMVKNQILTDSELDEGLILTCQSHPLTESISIDYDDV